MCIEVPLFTKWVIASSFEVILARPSRHSITGTLSSATSGSRWFSLILLHERIRRRIQLCHFSTLVDIVTVTAIVSFRKLPSGLPLSTISKNSLSTLFRSRKSEYNGYPRSFNNDSSRSFCGPFWVILRVLWAWSTSVLPDLSSTVADTITGELWLSTRSSRSRVLVSFTVGDEDELEEDVGQCLSYLESVLEVDESVLEDDFDKPGTKIGTKFSVLHCILIPFVMRCGFCPLTIQENIRFYRTAFLATILLACFRGLSVRNISNSWTYTVACSCVCTSPLALMTIVRLHDFVKVSISTSLKSFLLIICIDAPESTTNSRSSSLRFECKQAPIFRRWEECCSFMLLSFLIHFWPASTLLRGHLALAILSPLETDPQILERWGYAHEVHLGKIIPSERSWSRILVWNALAFVNFTRWIGFGMSVLFRRMDFGGFMSWETQPNCRVFDDRRPTSPCLNSWQVSRLTSGLPSRPWLFWRLIARCRMLSCRSP